MSASTRESTAVLIGAAAGFASLVVFWVAAFFFPTMIGSWLMYGSASTAIGVGIASAKWYLRIHPVS